MTIDHNLHIDSLHTEKEMISLYWEVVVERNYFQGIWKLFKSLEELPHNLFILCQGCQFGYKHDIFKEKKSKSTLIDWCSGRTHLVTAQNTKLFCQTHDV